ncbi:MAG: hypothetical protein QXI39_02505 [Candidatus Bathyarchaeia archaeon]
MKTLVVYYSRTGNTRKVAESIAQILGSDIEEVLDERKRTGVWVGLGQGWMQA